MSSVKFTNWLFATSGASSLQVITLDLPNPEWHPATQPFRVNSSLAYTFVSSPGSLSTVSNVGANSNNDVTGLIYTPNLATDSQCRNITAPYVPQNVTRRANLPPTDYDLIGVAPWVTPECSLEYMVSARGSPIRGFLFFLPGTTGTPPGGNDQQWNIPNGGNWKGDNGFPVYAINGLSATYLMNASALYSGNMTDVPFGHQLTELYDPRDYVRLFADFNTGIYNSPLTCAYTVN